MTNTRIRTIAALLLLTVACDDPEGLSEPRDTDPREAEVGEVPGGLAQAVDATPGAGHPGAGPARSMPGAKAAFEAVAELVEEKYVDGPLDEDALWTGAIEGVLGRLVQLEHHPINTLLSPQEFEELAIGTKGKMLGVGIMIERVADVVVVREVIAGGPAETAGLKAGDRILGIDGERIAALDIHEIVNRIRGEDGSNVQLFVQRDTEEWNETITRGAVDVPSVQAVMLDETVGYLRIGSFAQGTADEIDARLGELGEADMKALVLDVRDCPGGLLDAALAVADRFLAPGATIVRIKGRDGIEDTIAAKEEHPWQTLPMAVLIGKSTASGAEILADALHEHGRATLVGEPTLGKRTVEAIHELGNGWAVKLSVSRFESASGETRQGVGVVPQIRIPAGDPGEKVHRIPIAEVPGSDDAALAAARELVASAR